MLIRIITSRQMKKLLKSRIFAVLVLAAFSLAAVSAVSARGKAVRIMDGETTKSIYTLRTNPEDIISLADIKLQEGDEYSFSGFKNKRADLEIYRAVEVTVECGGEKKQVRLARGTVLDAVTLAGYQMAEHDYLNVDLCANLNNGMEIQVNSIDYVFVKEEKILRYTTKTVYSDTVAKNEVVKKVGSEGLQVLTYKQKTLNGEIVSSELVSSETIKEPVHEEKIIGTKVQKAPVIKSTTADLKTVSVLVPGSPIELDKNGRPVSYKKLLTGKATGYSPNDGGITATGKAVKAGYIAVNPKIIPYGTKMFIVTPDGKYIYGYASAEDTGGFIKSGKILADLFFNSYSEARAFGVRDIEIYILN